MADKKISELPVASAIGATDISVLVSDGTDYQFTFSQLIQFLSANLPTGDNYSYGTTIPQDNTGKDGDVFLKTNTATFYQKLNGTWTLSYTIPTGSGPDGTLRYGLGVPGTAIGANNDSYIDTSTGIFYLKTAGTWAQVYSMATGPSGPRGAAGTNGTNGTNGNTILHGTTNPSNTADGVDGDFYLNLSTYFLFGPKSAGVWPAGESIIGADGEGLVSGGTTGQILAKKTADDFDTQWIDTPPIGDLSTLTTTQKGTITGAINEVVADISSEATTRSNADTTLQTNINNKVDKLTGYQLSQENYTTAEKTKLASLSDHYKGTYTSSTALTAANPTGNPGDYAFVDPGTGADAKMYIWDNTDNSWVLSSGTGTIAAATETNAGISALATLTQALAGINDTNAMTALKTLSVILDQKKNVNYQIAPVSLNEVSFLMLNVGNINAITISGASNAKLKTGITGTYPTGAQTFPYAYAAGDRVFVTYNYTDLNNASCNIILTCRDN